MSTTKQVQDPVQTPSFFPDPMDSDIDDDDSDNDDADGEDEGKDVQTPSFFPDPMARAPKHINPNQTTTEEKLYCVLQKRS